MLAETEEMILDQSGRPLGVRAQATRERLLEATGRLIEGRSLRELKVADIAREVGTSPATFYQYFKDAEDAVLQLATWATAEMPAIVSLIYGDWGGERGLERARRIANAFIEHWDQYRAALRIRNTASDEGDMRFQRLRHEAMTPIIGALARQIEVNRDSGKPSGEHPHAAAAAMGAILERLSAYHNELDFFGVTREELVETTAHILWRTVGQES